MRKDEACNGLLREMETLRHLVAQLQESEIRRHEAEEVLRHHLEFERLVTTISTKFINVPPHQVDRVISQALKTIGQFSKTDRGYVFLFSENATVMDNTHEWCGPGIISHRSRLQDIEFERAFPYFAGIMQKGEVFNVPDVAVLPAAAELERREFHLEGIKSLVVVPMVYGGSLMGCIGFDSVRRLKTWLEGEIVLLRMVGEVFAGALLRKATEEQLTESEERYRMAIEHSNDGVAMVSGDTHLYVNRRFLEIFGYESAGEVVGKPIAITVHPDDFLRVSGINRDRQQGKPVPGRYRFKGAKKDGGTVYVEVSATGITYKGETVSLAYIRDVTDRKRTEDRLWLTQFSVDHASDAVFWFRRDGSVAYGNEAACLSLGYTREELLSLKVADFDPDHSVPRGKTLWDKTRASGSFTFQSSHRRKDGSLFPVEVTGTYLSFEGEEYLFCFSRDITERARAEEAVRDSEQRLANIIEFLPDATLVIDCEGRVIAWNKAVEVLTGVEAEAMVGKGDYQYALPFYGTRRPILVDLVLSPPHNLDEQYSNVKRQDGILVGEARISDFRGRSVVLFGTAAPLKDSKGNVVGAIESIRDVTEWKKAEEELQKLSKIESLGVLAGGIAHDFNNMLTAILGNISLARLYLSSDGDRAVKRLADAEAGIVRARDLTRQLLTFSKGGAPIRKTMSIEPVVRASALFALSGSPVRCEFDFVGDLRPVDIDEGQIGQVVNNLVINGQQAMHHGGVIRIRGRNVSTLETAGLPLPRRDHVEIVVEDEGAGISPEHLDKIFDPYFTTKQKGSGLGLATVYSIVKRHDGYITVRSESGRGSSFLLYLPVAGNDCAAAARQKEEGLCRGEGRILVMEDEDMIRETVGEMLASLGYQACMARDGVEALKYFQEAGESHSPFRAVILDLTIPGGMGGRETMERLLAIDPAVRAVVSSGYSNDPIMASYEQYGFKGVMTKPYQLKDLGETLRTVLSS